MLPPIADKNHADLLDEGGALPRNAEGQVSLKGLQHIGARARDFPDLHSVKVPPGGFPSATASSALGAQPVHNVYALDFRTLLGHHADMVEKDRQVRAAPDAEGDVTGASDWSSSPKRISELAENTLTSLHNQGWDAIDLFEVVLVFSLWFQAAGRQAAGRESAVDETPPEREIADVSTKELLDISGHLMETLRVAIGSTDAAGLTMMCMPEFLGDDVLYYSQSMEGVTGGAVDDIEEGVGEAAPVLRKLEDAVDLFHQKKVTFITDSLDAVDHDTSERACRLVQARVGFGVAEHSVKALHMALSSDSLGGELDKDGKLPGHGVSFNFKRERSFGEFGHFYDGQRVGLWLGPDGPHEGNH
ncbi:unnamed protein product [Ectocarpus sp. CCAP 1310/34]|nr:unnamed protein product [Ectocarpus sp. CCAP 1310/34]